MLYVKLIYISWKLCMEEFRIFDVLLEFVLYKYGSNCN